MNIQYKIHGEVHDRIGMIVEGGVYDKVHNRIYYYLRDKLMSVTDNVVDRIRSGL